MLTTIEGVNENGHVIFKEAPPVIKRSKVLVTFIEDQEPSTSLKKRPLGTMRGTIRISEGFNDPLDDLKEYV